MDPPRWDWGFMVNVQLVVKAFGSHVDQYSKPLCFASVMIFSAKVFLDNRSNPE